MSAEIREIRKKLGLSQEKMADLLVISRSKLALLESGKRNLSPATLQMLEGLKKSIAPAHVLPPSDELSFREIGEKVNNEIREELNKQENKLLNLIFNLNRSKYKLEQTKSALAFICEEMQNFSGVPSYFSRLQKIHSELLDCYADHSPERIEYMEIQIDLLKNSIQQLSTYLNAKM